MQHARTFEVKTGYGEREREPTYKREATAATSLGFVSGHVPDFFSGLHGWAVDPLTLRNIRRFQPKDRPCRPGVHDPLWRFDAVLRSVFRPSRTVENHVRLARRFSGSDRSNGNGSDRVADDRLAICDW